MIEIIVQILPYLFISVLFIPISVIFHEIGHLLTIYICSRKYTPPYPLTFKSHLKIWNETLAGVTTATYTKEGILINYEDFLLEHGKIVAIITIYFMGFITQIFLFSY